MNPYYGVRRLGPYLGIIQLIDVGDACAYSTNGRSWRIRQRTMSGGFRWGATLVSDETVEEVQIVGADRLVDALRRQPRIPFPVRDRYELWLLNSRNGKPLALLRTTYRKQDVDKVEDPHWRPFTLTETCFVSSSVERIEADSVQRHRKTPHRDRLDRLVNMASRPMPVAEWFERQPDGSGTSLGGLRVQHNDIGRRLAANDFPALLVSEDWQDEKDKVLVDDYHDWQASLLLGHQNLSQATRRRLERAACRRPQALLAAYPLIPEVLDEEAMRVALVSARLMNAS